ncbi:hypothetical protein PTRA_a2580 [Pseudoalteromonas translucida KMM 520]|uniref:Uncharacterized protein n=1 Tax=Pseudoalteromonas translucida KMM 520 TaxID=1315283 RepID=A0A0U2LPC9_9GAMM|nr:hypothetical protein PTRA_a2580 [Pseudoalteromonas translucida KMM 520]
MVDVHLSAIGVNAAKACSILLIIMRQANIKNKYVFKRCCISAMP